ncbi:MAG: YciI family protein [Stackebrandtia sp.]
MKFALMILETAESKRSIAADAAAHGAAIGTWMGEQGQAGNLVGGEAFDTVGRKPAVVRKSGADVAVTNEPFAGGTETIGGYVLVEAADEAEAVAMAKTWPTPETLEIWPVLPM